MQEQPERPQVADTGPSVRQDAFVIDLRRCIGCDTCVVGCKMEHGLPLGALRLKVSDSSGRLESRGPQGIWPNLSQYWVPRMCQHCDAAPCIRSCPTRALWRDALSSAVTLDKERCIGCRRCEEECPYDALWFDDETGVADKCDQCSHRRADGKGPICELVCPTRAIHFGDAADPQSDVSRLLAARENQQLEPESGAAPRIWFLSP